MADDLFARFDFEAGRIGVITACIGGWLTDGKPEGWAFMDMKFEVADGGRMS